MKSPFEASGALGELEFEIVKVCEKLKPDLFRELKSFYKSYHFGKVDQLSQTPGKSGLAALVGPGQHKKALPFPADHVIADHLPSGRL